MDVNWDVVDGDIVAIGSIFVEEGIIVVGGVEGNVFTDGGVTGGVIVVIALLKGESFSNNNSLAASS